MDGNLIGKIDRIVYKLSDISVVFRSNILSYIDNSQGVSVLYIIRMIL